MPKSLLITIERRVSDTIRIDEQFPLFRAREVEDDVVEYYKFDGFNRLTIITDRSHGCNMSILHLEDPAHDFVRAHLSEDMLEGHNNCDRITEATFERARQRLRALMLRAEGCPHPLEIEDECTSVL